MSLNLETVARFSNEAAAQLLVMRLRDKGITTYVTNQFIHTLKGALPFNIADLLVQVASEDLSQAQEIAAQKLPELDDAEATALEDAAEALAICPGCGSEDLEYAEDAGRIAGACAACGHQWTLE